MKFTTNCKSKISDMKIMKFTTNCKSKISDMKIMKFTTNCKSKISDMKIMKFTTNCKLILKKFYENLKINIRKFRFFGDPGAFSTSKSITFTGSKFVMEVKENKEYDSRPRNSKWYNKTDVRIYILAIFEIIFYVIIGKPFYANWHISLYFFGVFITSMLIFNYLLNNSYKLRMNHGAEHKVINAFLNHDLKNVEKYSRFSDDCGSNIYSILILLLVISPIVKLPVTIFSIYMTIYSKISIVRKVTFNTIGKFVQTLTTAEPTKEILENTKIGFEKLIDLEVEKMIEEEFIKIRGEIYAKLRINEKVDEHL